MTICKAQNDIVQIKCPINELINPSKCASLVCTNDDYSAGTVCEASCCPGEILMGNSTTVCQYDGTWSNPLWFCTGKTCVMTSQLLDDVYR